VKLGTLSPLPVADFKRKFGTVFDLEMSPTELLQRAQLEKWFREGDDNTLVEEVPYPTNADGKRLPHGAVLDFAQVPVELQPRRTLVWWLRLRHVNVPMDYPSNSFMSECGGCLLSYTLAFIFLHIHIRTHTRMLTHTTHTSSHTYTYAQGQPNSVWLNWLKGSCVKTRPV